MMDPIVVTMPASMTDDEYLAAVENMSRQLTAAGIDVGRQWIDLSQADDGSWVITGRENDSWWAS